jgi:hypothetical protein
MNQHMEPRYEFRLFGKEFGPLIKHMEQSHQPINQATETNLYILAATNLDYSVKIRNGKLDTKVLRRREQGLERWYPHLQMAFPLSSALLREFVFSWLQVDLPPLLRQRYTMQQFLQEAVAAVPALQVAKVDKQRCHYMLYGCRVEIGDLRINDQIELRTVAVEASEASKVARTVEILDLQDDKNTSYGAGLLQWLAPERAQRKPNTPIVGEKAAAPCARQPVLVR